MENASKALIIAGAILLAIVLVSLGVLVINNARGDIENQNIDQATIDSFNSKITAYCGSGKSGTEMNNLMDVIAASNGAQKNKAEKHYIQVNQSSSVTSTATDTLYGFKYDSSNKKWVQETNKGYPTFDNSMLYNARPEYDVNGSGYIISVKIMKN